MGTSPKGNTGCKRLCRVKLTPAYTPKGAVLAIRKGLPVEIKLVGLAQLGRTERSILSWCNLAILKTRMPMCWTGAQFDPS